MKAIFRRELRGFFHRFGGFLFFALYFAMTGLFLTVYHLLYGYSDFEGTLSLLSVGGGILLPFVAVPLFADRRSEAETRFLRALPLSEREIFLGKYLAGLAILGIMTAVAAICPILIGFFGQTQYLSAYAAVLETFLIWHAVLSVCMFLSSRISHRRVVWLASFGVVGILAVLRYVAGILPSVLGTVVSYGSLFGVFTPFAYGILDIPSLLWPLSVSAIFLLLTAYDDRRDVCEKNGKKGGEQA